MPKILILLSPDKKHQVVILVKDKVEKFRPTYQALGVSSINFSALGKMGIDFVIVDLDGTITLTLSNKIHNDSAFFLRNAKNKGYITEVCILSNCWLPFMSSRVEKIANDNDFKHCTCCWPGPIKPQRNAFEWALSQMSGATARNTIIIGDQLGTDILGANLLGIPSIWVPSIEPIPLWKKITLEVINQHRLRALGEIPRFPTRL